MLCIFILYISILTHASPSPPFLTFGARHSHGCGRLYACSPPGSTQCPPFTVLVLVINTHYYYCQRGRPQDFVAGTRVSRSGLPRVFVSVLACKCLVVAAAAHALCSPHSQPPPSTRLVCGNRSTCLRPSARGTPCATGAPCHRHPGGRCVVQYTTRPVDPSATVRTTTRADAGACEAREVRRGRETWRLRRLPHACPPRTSSSAHSDAPLSTSTQRLPPESHAQHAEDELATLRTTNAALLRRLQQKRRTGAVTKRSTWKPHSLHPMPPDTPSLLEPKDVLSVRNSVLQWLGVFCDNYTASSLHLLHHDIYMVLKKLLGKSLMVSHLFNQVTTETSRCASAFWDLLLKTFPPSCP